MSTKNLARTVIEGGRGHYNQSERWHSNRVERRRAHQLERALRLQAEDEDALFQPRTVVWPSFSDKLGKMLPSGFREQFIGAAAVPKPPHGQRGDWT